MKKLNKITFSTFVFFIIIFSLNTQIFANISIKLNGENVNIENSALIIDGCTLIPARDITSIIGVKILWNENLRQIEIDRDNTKIVTSIESNIAIVNGNEVELDTATRIIDGTTFLPLRFVAESFGLNVSFNNNVIYINTNSLNFPSATVRRIIDGDTIELTNGEIVRFIGIDTPERGEAGFNEAIEFLSSYIGPGSTVFLQSSGNDRDRFNRLRRYVWIEPNINLNNRLLESGHAVPFPQNTQEENSPNTLIVTAPSTVIRGERPIVTIQGKPNTRYTISVRLGNSGNLSTAQGLEPRNTNAAGVTSWTWLVGNRTAEQNLYVTIEGGGEQVTQIIRVIAN
ncbi:MAG: stalk domain-containing protein [Defluviitaleaceae bacterium]|nr:stalk domain-containing protein [Defluviitaleaceae bacterium]